MKLGPKHSRGEAEQIIVRAMNINLTEKAREAAMAGDQDTGLTGGFLSKVAQVFCTR